MPRLRSRRWYFEQFDYMTASGCLTRQFTVSMPLADRAVKLSDERIAARWITAEDVIDTPCTPETRGVLESWFDPLGPRGVA